MGRVGVREGVRVVVVQPLRVRPAWPSRHPAEVRLEVLGHVIEEQIPVPRPKRVFAHFLHW